MLNEIQDKIYKINHITLDEKAQKFCVSHDHGIKIFNMEDFRLEETSDNSECKLGSISHVCFFQKYEDLIIFTGSIKNVDFPPNTIIFFDIKKKNIDLKKEFQKEITNFKCVSNFVFIAFGTSLIIYSYDKNKNDLEQKEEHKIEENSIFECWVEGQEDILNNLYLAFPCEKEIIILFYSIDEWNFGNKLNIPSPVDKIQNIFYIKKLNQIFISDESAKYIYGFDIDDGKKKLCLYRGTKPGFITSISLLNDKKFLAINNLNRTIHIYDLDIKNNDFSISNVFYEYFSDITEIYPKLRIYYENILENEEGAFYKNDFLEKGGIIYSDNNDELNIIAYNGYAFKIKINFKNMTYKTILKEEYIEKKIEKKIKNISLYNSGFDA